MKYYSTLLLVFIYLNIGAQTTFTTTPQFPTEIDQITIVFDVTYQTKTLVSYSGDVYVHTGVYINNDNSSWKYVVGSWGNNTVQPKMTSLGSNRYQIIINNPRSFYGVTSSLEKITSLNFVLRSSDATKQTEDIRIPIYSSGISIVLNTPTVNLNYGDVMRSPVCVSPGLTTPISVSITSAGTTTLFINGIQKAQTTTNSLSYNFVADDYSTSRNDIKIIATDNASHKDSILFVIFKNPTIKNLPLPSGNQIGINYGSDPTKVTLAFYAPKKSFVYVIGEFGKNDWKVDETYFMNRYEVKTDSVIWWATISNLESGKEYAYQFLVDGNLRIYDPYTEKILDEESDKYIPTTVYPNLKAYPSGKTSGLVSVLQTNQTAYSWKVPSFTRPAKEKLVIYELLIRDFVSTHWYKTIMDTLSYLKKLGVTAIELMPIIEFGGNDSWGYNPITFFAPDKYYGTKNDLKAFIDACHQNGIAVIQDIVLNHAYNDNSMAQLYWDNVNSRPAANNPWFNTVSPNSSYSYGNDFNHESKDTKYFIDRVTSFWLTEYKFDGFRFDFTKGFTNTPGEGTPYDASRIAILKRIANKIWSVSPGAYVILEHFCDNLEEMELAGYGMMLWGNLNSAYYQSTMGYSTNPSWDISRISYKYRGWGVPNLVGYMESHDEERLMYKNITYGNSNSSYNVKNLTTALSRIQLAANLFLLVPGPKMIWQFGELGYDQSIDLNGRLGDKPVPWSDGLNYYSNGNRRKIFNTFASLIKLKNNYPAFSSTEFLLNGSFPVKSLYIIDPTSMNVAVMGNFDIVAQNYQTLFQNTGKWYEFFSGDSLNVSDVNMYINLQPGEFRLYTTQRIIKTDIINDVKTENAIPNDFSLSQNYPNPFNPSTVISYQLPASGYVTLKVFDLLGREVVTLVDEFKNAGTYNSQFSILNSQLPSGIYFYRLQSGKFISTKKMVLIK
jgi:1,4-alpha-glucan branching enzyme